MATKIKKRINISISRDMNTILIKLAERDDVPIATKALELLKGAVLTEEDDVLNTLASQRDTTHTHYLSHEQAWRSSF